MNFTEMDSLVRTLLHTLWQGGLLFLALSALLALIPVRRARLRYLLSLLALTAILLAGIATWAWIDASASRSHPVPATAFATASASGYPPVRANAALPNAAKTEMPPALSTSSANPHKPGASFPRIPRGWVPWVAGLWAAGVAIFVIRGVTAILGAERIGKKSRPVEDSAILELARKIRKALGIRTPIRLRVAERIGIPAVIGVFRPVVLIPASLLTGLPREYLQAVLAHEFAHIARWDYLVNIGQMLEEALLFFNPFVWWISRQIRLEREACCDRLAAAHCADPGLYLKAVLACVENARESREEMGGLPAAALAMDGSPENRNRPLADRAKRLLAPGHKGSVRVPWLTLAGIMVVTGLILFAMGKGALWAAHVLTPQERIARITELQKETHMAPIEEKEIVVSGTVAREDGKPLTERAQICINSRRSMNSSSHSTTLPSNGTFSIKMPSGTIHVGALDRQQAPAFVGPLQGDHDLTDLRLVLREGFPAVIRATDLQGQPLEGVAISGYYQGATQMNVSTVTTDASGEARMEGVSSDPIALEAAKAGYQTARFEQTKLMPGKPESLVLAPAHPVKGRVVSEETGDPVSNAKISTIYIDGPNGQNRSFSKEGDEANTVRTNAQGEFTLNTLRDDASYWLHIQAEGYRPTQSERITTQSEAVELKLGRPLHIKGKVIFSQSGAPSGKVVIQCEQYLHLLNHQQGVGQQMEAQVKDGVAEFHFKDLYLDRTDTEIIVNGIHTKVPDFHESIDGLVIDLSQPQRAAVLKEEPKRWVVIRLTPPKGLPPPTGTLEVTRLEHAIQPEVRRMGTMEHPRIENGEAWMEVPVPNELNLRAGGLLGYWFQDYAAHRVGAGNGPFEIRIPVHPAGAIYGDIQEADGGPARSVMISVISGTVLPNSNHFSLDVKDYSQSTGDTQRQFFATPLPLGASYAVLVHRNATYAVSEPVWVDEKTPIQKIQLTIPEGTMVRGRVADEDGHPVFPLTFSLTYAPHPNQRFSSQEGHTGQDGRFAIPNVNFAVPGEYLLTIEPRAGYVPAMIKIEPKTTELNVRLAKGCVVTGTAVNVETGQPLTGAEVYAAPLSQSPTPPSDPIFSFSLRAESVTDEQGRFRFSNLPAGRAVRIGAYIANDADTSSPTVVTSNREAAQSVVLKLKPVPR